MRQMSNMPCLLNATICNNFLELVHSVAFSRVRVNDDIVRTEYTHREDQNKARIGQKHSVSFNIFIIKGINVITIQYRYIGFRVL